MAFHSGLIDRLFARFGAMYGSKFLDMWANSEMSDVKKCWSDELRIFSVEQVGIAVGNLKVKNFPPTLPEFLQLCESARALKPRVTPYVALPDVIKGDKNSQDIEEAKARCLETVARLGTTFGKPSNAWAHKILARHEARGHLPADSLRMARQALRFEA